MDYKCCEILKLRTPDIGTAIPSSVTAPPCSVREISKNIPVRKPVLIQIAR